MRRLTSTLCLASLLATAALAPRPAHAGDGDNRSIGPIAASITLTASDLACNCDLIVSVAPGANVTITLPAPSVGWTPSVTVVSEDGFSASFVVVAPQGALTGSPFTTRAAWTAHSGSRKWLRTG